MKTLSYFPRVGVLVVLCQLLVSFSYAALQVQIGQNFAGSDNTDSQITPADGNGAIGPKHFVEFINGDFVVYSKTNGVHLRRITDAQFWANANVVISSDATISDPRVIFDTQSQRWFASQVDLNASAADPTIYANNFLLAVSDTADPMGNWHGVKFIADPDTGLFADFPTIGVDSNALYISGDMFADQNTPVGPSLWSIPKADLLINQNPAIISNATFYGDMSYSDRGDVLQPATCMDGSSSGDIIAVGDILSSSSLIASKVLNANTTNATLLPGTTISVTSFTAPMDAAQPDGTTTLADNDSRISAKVYTVGGIMYAVHTVSVNNHAAIRWYRVNSTNYTLLESGTITSGNLDLIFPSIAATANGVIMICCNGSSSTTPISSYAFAGQTVNGATTFGSAILLQGGSITDYHDLNETLGGAPDSRWGDYSATSVDPADPSRFWTIQMLPLTSENWVTHITEMIVVPQLTIASAGNGVTVSWPLYAAKYQLQASNTLAASNGWAFVTQTPSTNSNSISVTLPAGTAPQFFRLVEQP